MSLFLVKLTAVRVIFEEFSLVSEIRASYKTPLIMAGCKGWNGQGCLSKLSNHIYEYFILLLTNML